MYILVTYDVCSKDATGNRRLRKVAKICAQYGQRVQSSVFECLVSPAQYEEIKHQLCNVIDERRDSLMFYNLGKNWRRRVERMGVKCPYDPEDVLLI